jgi:hypothetical protein
MATANTVQVRRPVITVPGALTDSIEYQASVPVVGAPNINYTTHEAGGDRIENPTADELIQRVAQAQQLMFQPPTINVVNMVDGAGNFAMFTGYDTGPQHTIMFNGLKTGKSLVHRCARLSFINTTIYRSDPNTPVAEAIYVLNEAANPCAALKLILQELIKEFLEVGSGGENTSDFEIRKKIHENNIKIIEEEWYPILDASTDSAIDSFTEASKNPSIQIKMYDSIKSVYLSGADNFFTVIAQFSSMFQMLFIPGHMGTTPGKFIPITAVLSNPESKGVNIISLAMNPGPKQFLSVTAVAVRGLPAASPPVGQAVIPAGYNMITWPETLPESGLTKVIQMPYWLPEDLYPLEILKDGKNLDFNSNLQKVKTAEEEITDAGLLVEKICRDIARLTYNYESLNQSSAGIICPFDVTWEVGKRYTIEQPNKASDGSSNLFSGFLTQVVHRVNSSPATPQAVTQLTFSHVEANGFTLPNK